MIAAIGQVTCLLFVVPPPSRQVAHADGSGVYWQFSCYHKVDYDIQQLSQRIQRPIIVPAARESALATAGVDPGHSLQSAPETQSLQ